MKSSKPNRRLFSLIYDDVLTTIQASLTKTKMPGYIS